MNKQEALEALLAKAICTTTDLGNVVGCDTHCPKYIKLKNEEDDTTCLCSDITDKEVVEAIITLKGYKMVDYQIKDDKLCERPSWDAYFMELADVIAKRSTCLRRQVGAVIVKDNRIMTTGYNGAPSGISHCKDYGGCLRQQRDIPSGERHELCRAIHAEQNAIIQAAYLGISIKDSTLYCTTQPCVICAKMIISAGVKRIVIKEKYPDALAEEILDAANLEPEVFEGGR